MTTIQTRSVLTDGEAAPWKLSMFIIFRQQAELLHTAEKESWLVHINK